MQTKVGRVGISSEGYLVFDLEGDLGAGELPSYHPSRGMSASDLGDEREGKLNSGVRVLTPRNAAFGICSFLLVLLRILLIVPVSNYDLSVQGYRLLYANPARAASFLQWWQQWSIPLGGFLTVSGVASVSFLVFLAFRLNRKGQRE